MTAVRTGSSRRLTDRGRGDPGRRRAGRAAGVGGIRSSPGGVTLLRDGPSGDPVLRVGTVEAVARVLPELTAEGWRFHQPDRRG